VVYLHPIGTINLPPIHDPDPIMQCDLMDGRDAFLQIARERHWEFSTLRHTKFSSMAMLYELHTQNRDSTFMYTCNTCKAHVETRWHCNVCEVSTSSDSICYLDIG
jgi:E1A/CREB-binding protein